ncbi:uncharacterized protein [Temnothorax nylanderi]|uniref:uncharacterized protein n=1 Tax=Temnothorax nylanderi TaxID=102681 RepID=UPI003A88736D
MEYGQHEDTWDSDHYPIEIRITTEIEDYKKKTNRFSTKKTKWKDYNYAMKKIVKENKETFNNILVEGAINKEEKYKTFIETIKATIKSITENFRSTEKTDDEDKEKKKRKIDKQRRRKVTWWDAECDEAITNRQRALKNFKRKKDTHSLVQYNKRKAEAKKIINRKKRESFDNFCASINRFTSPTYVWNTMRTFKNVKKKINWNSWKHKNREEEIRKEIEKLAPPSVQTAMEGQEGERYKEASVEDKFTKEELKRALEMIRRNSAPGRDGIEYKMLKDMTEEMEATLLSICNEVWTTDWFPEDWRKYQTMFIDKAGKEKVRPIALSSCVGKVMERMVNERLVWWAEHDDKLAKDQNGFRRGRSCAENLVKLSTDIRNGIYKHQYILTAFLDVSSAYDNVIYSILMKKLKKLNCPKNIMKFIGKWLYYRDTEFIISGQESEHRRVYKGLPQGAVLSPLLYALYTCNITDKEGVEYESVQFADDIAAYVIGHNRTENKRKLEKAVNSINEKLIELGLQLEPKKTVLVQFSKHGGCDNTYIEVQNTKIYAQREAKFLGIWLDSRLDFHKQVQETKGKVTKANSLMTYLNKKSKGMEVNTALMLYKSLIRAITDYGNFVYFPKEQNQKLKMERTQYLGIRTALGYRNSTPNNVIIAEAKVTLLRDRAELLARNFLSKISIYGDEEMCKRIEELTHNEDFARYKQPIHQRSIIGEAWRRIKWCRRKMGPRRKFEIFDMDYSTNTDYIEVDLDTGYYRKKKGTTDRQLMEKVKEKYNLEERYTVIYTDGSKKKNGKSLGASVVIEEQELAYNISIPKNCSTFTAEAIAIKATMEIMENEAENRPKDIVILTDAKAVLQALKNNHLNVYKNKYINEIRERHFRLIKVKMKRIIYIWIPAHIGIVGNEMADKLAKEATEEEEDETIEVPLLDFRQEFRREIWNKTQDSLIKDAKYKGIYYFKNFYNRKRKKPWFHKMNEERYFITLINRLRSNHFNVNESLARKGYIEDARCECGNECESIDHIIWRCNKYDEERERLDRELRARGITEEIDVTRILRRKEWITIRSVYNYIKRIGKII